MSKVKQLFVVLWPGFFQNSGRFEITISDSDPPVSPFLPFLQMISNTAIRGQQFRGQGESRITNIILEWWNREAFGIGIR